MTIDETTGEVSWIPTDQETGSQDFTVVATNSIASTSQLFTVEILDPCATDIGAYWRLDEPAGPYDDSFDDPTTDPNDAVCVTGNCPANIAGQVGNANDFNGTDNELSVVAGASQPTDWDAADSFSIELWVRADDLADSAPASNLTDVLIGRTEGNPAQLLWYIAIRRFAGETVDRVIVKLQNTDGEDVTPAAAGRQPLESTTDVADGEWHHIVLVRDEGTNENRLYIDGVQEASGVIDYSSGFASATAALNIGWLDLGDFLFDGVLDEVAIYESAMAEEVIEQHATTAPVRGYCNAAPEITSPPETAATIGAAYAYTPTAEDDEDDTPYLWRIETGPDDMTIDEATGAIAWTPPSDAADSVDVVINVRDQRGGTATQSFTITVSGGSTPTNNAPVIITTADTAATVGVLYRYPAAADDADGDTLTWTLSNEPDGMVVDTATGVVTWTPAVGTTTSGEVTLTCDDGNGGTATENFTITVSATGNTAPRITTTAPATATIGELYQYTPGAEDDDGDTLIWSLTNPPLDMNIDTASGVLTWTPAEGSEGEVTFTLAVSDGSGGSAEEIIRITVAARAADDGGGGGGGGGCFIDTTTSRANGGGVFLLLGGTLGIAGLLRKFI
jgi:hypothetical protein